MYCLVIIFWKLQTIVSENLNISPALTIQCCTANAAVWHV